MDAVEAATKRSRELGQQAMKPDERQEAPGLPAWVVPQAKQWRSETNSGDWESKALRPETGWYSPCSLEARIGRKEPGCANEQGGRGRRRGFLPGQDLAGLEIGFVW